MKEDGRPFLTVRSGRDIDLLSITPADIELTDIIHCLSRKQRYNCHTHRPVTVAEHSMLVHDMYHILLAREGLASVSFGRVERLLCLLHDAAETYTGDFLNPIKRWMYNLCPELKEVEDLVDDAIMAAFHLSSTPAIQARLAEADKWALRYEWDLAMSAPAENYTYLADVPTLASLDKACPSYATAAEYNRADVAVAKRARNTRRQWEPWFSEDRHTLEIEAEFRSTITSVLVPHLRRMKD